MILVSSVIGLTFLRQNSVVNLTGAAATIIITTVDVTEIVTESFHVPRR